jgi:hypothetical protein
MYQEWTPIGLHEEQDTSILKGEEFLEKHTEFSEIHTRENSPLV